MGFANLSLSHGNGTLAPQPWRKETVRAFFEGVAWRGQTLPPAGASSAAQAGHAGTMMTMSVNRFFDTIAWDGQPIIGVPIAPMEAQSAQKIQEDSLTLDGFSDLFG
jgi:hypothetical protein